MERGAEVGGGREPLLAILPHSKAWQGGEVVGWLLWELAGSRSRVRSGDGQGWEG